MIERMAWGEITPSEAAAVMSVVDAYRSAWEISDMEPRLAALEERMKP